MWGWQLQSEEAPLIIPHDAIVRNDFFHTVFDQIVSLLLLFALTKHDDQNLYKAQKNKHYCPMTHQKRNCSFLLKSYLGVQLLIHLQPNPLMNVPAHLNIQLRSKMKRQSFSLFFPAIECCLLGIPHQEN
ncbi:hypothetical protein A3195_09870 [Candidatus Thiodiazotropha endoloripes]|uniref:Uncharacterized protein n=1 Tax=Candidatus Thiodiazotropha endoloripes TaxID=1818881 RepID=A0A1E2UQS2_9GAMM|nr:hypothetical protein A3195_09870 [Candidatus Thiodiazotropha endoloripes]ODB97090.1 hypothetical protein A3196_10120 [Candidatus Thiodiazotropha endoloripes]